MSLHDVRSLQEAQLVLSQCECKLSLVKDFGKYGITPLFNAETGDIAQLFIDIVKQGEGEQAAIEYVNTQTAYGDTALMYAVSSDVIRVLVNEGAEVNEPDTEGKSMLHLAAEALDIEMIHLLMRKGADVNIRDLDNRTPLYYVADPAVRELLISFGGL